ncbi:ParB/RepB/Spo0J family partition protein [Myxococcota bacterium]|nr:ParB/RepB/Spo0J family partition protein [Myxococcota bacterium]MBU1537761.1 ParB/RepB/Spo0J family partition protein [Myxococcota bacterium]
MAAKTKNKALGRGLSALLPASTKVAPAQKAASSPRETSGDLSPEETQSLTFIPITQVKPAPNQPRKALDEERLEELTESIREKGILSPIIVRELAANEYGIIAGERRWRAAGRAGITRIPVIIKEADELEAFELALIENIQRSDLSALEEAFSYNHLMNSRGYHQEVVAQKVGKKRSTIANALRLLRLPEPVKKLLEDNVLSTGHARALLGLSSESEIVDVAHDVVKRQLSVRETEKLVQAERKTPQTRRKKPQNSGLRVVEDRLRLSLGTKVKLREKSNGKGSITIDYYTLEQLDAIIERLILENDDGPKDS